MAATVVLPALEPRVAAPPEMAPVTVTPVTPLRVTDPPAVVTEARFSKEEVTNCTNPDPVVMRFWNDAVPAPAGSEMSPVVVMSLEAVMVPGLPPKVRLTSGVFEPTAEESVVPVVPVRVRALAPSMAPVNLRTGASTVESAPRVMALANWMRVPAVRLAFKSTAPAPTWAMVPSEETRLPVRVRVSALLRVMSDPAVRLETEAVPVVVRVRVPEIWLVPATVMEEPERLRLLR